MHSLFQKYLQPAILFQIAEWFYSILVVNKVIKSHDFAIFIGKCIVIMIKLPGFCTRIDDFINLRADLVNFWRNLEIKKFYSAPGLVLGLRQVLSFQATFKRNKIKFFWSKSVKWMRHKIDFYWHVPKNAEKIVIGPGRALGVGVEIWKVSRLVPGDSQIYIPSFKKIGPSKRVKSLVYRIIIIRRRRNTRKTKDFQAPKGLENPMIVLKFIILPITCSLF